MGWHYSNLLNSLKDKGVCIDYFFFSGINKFIPKLIIFCITCIFLPVQCFCPMWFWKVMNNYIQEYLKLVSAIFQLLAYKTLTLKLILAFDGFSANSILFHLTSLLIIILPQKYRMPFHVLTLSNDPSKRNFGSLVIWLVDERECRKATCLAIHLEGLISQQLEFHVKICQ